MTHQPEVPSRPAAPSSDHWTTRRLLDWLTGYLRERGIDDPRLTSELLLAHVLACQRIRLFMEVDRPASPGELTHLRELVKRVAAHEPVQYVLGEGWFYGRPFHVNRTTLIPRPSTETLVEKVIWRLRSRGAAATAPERGPLILDIGTGTGCIAITLAKEIPSARVIAADIDEQILALARRNAEMHGVADRVEFRAGSLFDPLRQGERFDVVCSNPPYIPDGEWPDVPRNVREHEPEGALRGGADGLDIIRALITQAVQHLEPGGLLAVEIASVHHEEVIRLAREAGFATADVVKDHEQKWRVLLAGI